MTRDDLQGALRLSTQAGWNQTPADWRRLIDLSPEGCFAGRIGGELVATATVVSYGRDASWVGMVLVDQARRGCGLGSAILQHAIEHASRLGPFGLDATDLGRPVYLRQGFVDVAPIDRWTGTLRPTGPATDTRLIDRSAFEEVARLDREACGIDRSTLLLHLLGEPDVTGWLVPEGGYAILRPGREHPHLGPVVAADTAVLETLLAAAAPFAAGRTVFVDAPRDPALGEALASAGLAVCRRLIRMTHGTPRPLLLGDRVAAATAFEWG